MERDVIDSALAHCPTVLLVRPDRDWWTEIASLIARASAAEDRLEAQTLTESLISAGGESPNSAVESRLSVHKRRNGSNGHKARNGHNGVNGQEVPEGISARNNENGRSGHNFLVPPSEPIVRTDT